MKRTALIGVSAALLWLSACGGEEASAPQDAAAPPPEAEDQLLAPESVAGLSPAEAIETHMAYLASDALEGREAGSEGYEKAAAYAAAEFERLGLKPAGENGTYFQTVPLARSYRVAEAGDMTVTMPDGQTVDFEKNVDFAIGASTRFESSSREAPTVFVGYGVVAPDMGRDDYEGLDVEGKIVFMLSGTPSGIQTEERAYYGSRKTAEASARGAVGVVQLETPQRRKIYSFKRLVGEGRLDSARMSWVQADGAPFSRAPGIEVGASVSLEGAGKLFALTDTPYDEIIAASEAEGGKVGGFDLPFTVSISQGSRIDTVESPNVIAMIEGSDPDLKAEVIVLTAHLDHIGISDSFSGDRINNGALDNAAGVATLLEVARKMSEGEAPRRSVMFLLVTAEEKGLLGAQYFAQNPTVDRERIVGNVNLDMPVLTYDFQDVVAFGSDRSNIADAVASAAEEMGMTLSPDPFPEQGVFTRSDHFRFVEIGVPSVFLATGFANGGEEAWNEHFAKNYHRPSDDMANDLDFAAAARFADVNYRIAMTLANRDERPLWKAGDFFARQFDGPMQAE
jgi:hypothetical protein